ncbi:MAG TPA: hypothetical protein VJY43_00505 [Methanocorpusculum sp.]|nr:hypothetical protein [Methanocorpusculum sp.]
MKKITYILCAIISACVGILSALLVDANPYWVVPLILAVPAFFIAVVLYVSAGTKDGDIPFVGY